MPALNFAVPNAQSVAPKASTSSSGKATQGADENVPQKDFAQELNARIKESSPEKAHSPEKTAAPAPAKTPAQTPAEAQDQAPSPTKELVKDSPAEPAESADTAAVAAASAATAAALAAILGQQAATSVPDTAEQPTDAQQPIAGRSEVSSVELIKAADTAASTSEVAANALAAAALQSAAQASPGKTVDAASIAVAEAAVAIAAAPTTEKPQATGALPDTESEPAAAAPTAAELAASQTLVTAIPAPPPVVSPPKAAPQTNAEPQASRAEDTQTIAANNTVSQSQSPGEKFEATPEVTKSEDKSQPAVPDAIADSSTLQTNQAQSFAEQLSARTSHLTRSESTQFPIQTQVAQPGWSEEIGDHVVWMANKDMGKAELVLTPAHLGRLEVSLSVSGDQTNATFVAATPAAREALEQSIPRLREVLSQAGLNLGQVNVSTNGSNSQGQQDARNTASSQATRSSRFGGIGNISGSTGTASFLRQTNGLVDTFA